MQNYVSPESHIKKVLKIHRQGKNRQVMDFRLSAMSTLDIVIGEILHRTIKETSKDGRAGFRPIEVILEALEEMKKKITD